MNHTLTCIRPTVPELRAECRVGDLSSPARCCWLAAAQQFHSECAPSCADTYSNNEQVTWSAAMSRSHDQRQWAGHMISGNEQVTQSRGNPFHVSDNKLLTFIYSAQGYVPNLSWTRKFGGKYDSNQLKFWWKKHTVTAQWPKLRFSAPGISGLADKFQIWLSYDCDNQMLPDSKAIL